MRINKKFNNRARWELNSHVILPVFYQNFSFSERSFQNFHSWDSWKNDVKVRVEVKMAEMSKCGRFIYYRILLSLLQEMHFSAISSVKKILFCPDYGGDCRQLYIKFRFLKYTSVTCLYTAGSLLIMVVSKIITD